MASPRAALALLLAAALSGLAGRAAAARVSPGLEGGEVEEAQANATLQATPAVDAEALLEDPEGGALLDRLTPVSNEPTAYRGYVKEISQAIVNHDEGALAVADYDGSDNKVRDGTILFNMVGTCPSGWLCGDQAVTVSDFGGNVMAYWSKPHPEIKQCTRDRHVKKGKCKNDSGQFGAMEKLFRGGGDYYVDSATKRAVVNKDGALMYVYLVYATTWSTWSGTMDGWLLFQKDPNAKEFFRIQFQSGKDAKFNFRGGPRKLSSFWPAKWEMDLP
ncbi:unnamed protein product [Prorocentrum cordatum]|uniref:Altered inheritance of mitochondria protein 24, mitochondrial n=1 Tax=Prorocentrum cordatum TaxID=2364126 RepID=A0ABN9W300_9DINO|nr:unnamed protein product [Polarella glacialis]